VRSAITLKREELSSCWRDSQQGGKKKVDFLHLTRPFKQIPGREDANSGEGAEVVAKKGCQERMLKKKEGGEKHVKEPPGISISSNGFKPGKGLCQKGSDKPTVQGTYTKGRLGK